jgi:hypothetical protein
MTHFQTAFIEGVAVQDVIDFWKEFYVFGEIDVLDAINEVRFYESGNRTFIFDQVNDEKWVRFETDLDDVYEFDEILRRLSESFRTRIIFLFHQTTSGDTRFAIFEKGRLTRSVYQAYIEHLGTMRMQQNFGPQLPFETRFNYPKKYREEWDNVFSRFDTDDLLADFGFRWSYSGPKFSLYHIEVIESKN